MKTQKRFKPLALILGLALMLTLSACGGEETPTPQPVEDISLDFVVAEGHVLPVQDLRLHVSTRGRVDDILVEEGQRVTPDQVLLELGDRQNAEASLRAAELELKQAEQDMEDFTRTADLSTAEAWQAYLQAQVRRAEAEREWEDLDLDQLEDDVDEAQGEVNELEDELEEAREEFEIYQDLDEENADRQNAEDDLEEAREDYNEAVRDLEEAQREIDVPRAELDAALAAEEEARREYELRAEEGADPDQRELLASRIEAAEARVEAAEEALAQYTLTAPFGGTVTDVFLEAGQLVGPETPVMQLADLSQFVIETSDLTELEVVMLREGQAVDVVPDALPETTLTGTVQDISQSFTTQAGDVLYTATIHLDEEDPALRWGMTVEITFLKE